jgi:cyanophycin synthetase
VLKRVIVQNVADGGVAVLNALDPIVVGMANNCRGTVTFFGADCGHPVMSTHRAQGQRVVFVENGMLVAAQGKTELKVALSEVPITRNGSVGFQVENVMASVAAAWAVGTTWESICAGLKSFTNESDNAPGRFNVFNYRGATVIADYGHNPDAILALVSAVEGMPANRRSVVISGAGDRRDVDIRQQTEILGAAFDDVLLYQDQCQRGRADGEVVALLRQGLAGAKRTTHVDEINGEFVAIDKALARLGEGDLCLILIDQVEEALAHIAARIGQG